MAIYDNLSNNNPSPKAKKLTFNVNAYMAATSYNNSVTFYVEELKSITITHSATFKIRRYVATAPNGAIDTSYNAGTHTLDVLEDETIEMFYESIGSYKFVVFTVDDYE